MFLHQGNGTAPITVDDFYMIQEDGQTDPA